MGLDIFTLVPTVTKKKPPLRSRLEATVRDYPHFTVVQLSDWLDVSPARVWQLLQELGYRKQWMKDPGS